MGKRLTLPLTLAYIQWFNTFIYNIAHAGCTVRGRSSAAEPIRLLRYNYTATCWNYKGGSP